MTVGVQFRGTLQPDQSNRWFTFNWPQQLHIIWNVVPTSPKQGGPQVEWEVQVERASSQYITYWITVKNISDTALDFEARYAILNHLSTTSGLDSEFSFFAEKSAGEPSSALVAALSGANTLGNGEGSDSTDGGAAPAVVASEVFQKV